MDESEEESTEELQEETQNVCVISTTVESKPKGAKFRLNKQTVIEYVKRYIFLIVGLIIMAFGVAFSKKAALGASPISSIPFVLKPIAELDIGIATTIVNTLIVLLQVIILRKKFKWINLLQIPVCAVFGYVCQFAEWCLSGIALQTGLTAALCWQNWITCFAGIALVAFGVSMEVTANVITLAGEGLALALCQVQTKIKFRFMKVIVDVTLVLIAVALSFAFLKELYTDSVYFGTAAAAICVGLLAGQFNKFIKPLGIVYSDISKKKVDRPRSNTLLVQVAIK